MREIVSIVASVGKQSWELGSCGALKEQPKGGRQINTVTEGMDLSLNFV